MSAHLARAVAATILGVLAVVLAIGATVGWWLRGTVLDTPTWVATVAPLAADADVQAAVAGFTADQVVLLADAVVAAQASGTATQTAVARFLAGPGRTLVTESVRAFVATPGFARLWRDTNTSTHRQLVDLLEGRPTPGLTQRGGLVTADLTPLVVEVVVDLVDGQPLLRSLVPVDGLRGALTPAQARQGLAQLIGAPVPDAFARVVVADGDTLPALQTGSRLLADGVSAVLVVAVGIGLAALVLAPRRSVALVALGLGLTAGAWLAARLTDAVVDRVVDQVPDARTRRAAAATGRIVTRDLAPTVTVAVAAGLLLAAAGVAALVVGSIRRA